MTGSKCFTKASLYSLRESISPIRIGDIDSRKEYNEALVKHFEPVIDTFCSDCQSRLHTNPMRILDCKVDRDKRQSNFLMFHLNIQ